MRDMMPWNRIATIFISLSVASAAAVYGQTSAPANVLPGRNYFEGETLSYRMMGDNDGWRYAIQADAVVKKDAKGEYFEEYRWSNFSSSSPSAQPIPLTAASADFRESLSLAPGAALLVPNLSQVQPALIGPITDLLTFYADVKLAMSQKLAHSGDHVYVRHGQPSSWADGNYVLIGQDSIDFNVTLKSVDSDAKTATLLVRHVPPEQPQINAPVDWMRSPVADTQNNWIEVEKIGPNKFKAEVGKETFDVEIKISLADGKILSGRIDNPVEVLTRECADAALTTCGAPIRHQIRRQIELELRQ